MDFCRTYLSANWATFASNKLRLIIDDARAELEKSREKFGVIVGNLADPVEGGPCYQFYTQCFYEHVVMAKLADRGVFLMQAAAGGCADPQGGLLIHLQHPQARLQV
jgi:thermospermine synthase